MPDSAGGLFFAELPIDRKDNLLVIDIDGTLVPDDDSSIVADSVLTRLQQWGEANKVVLCSNGERHERNKQVADSIGVQLLKSHHQKPSAKLLSGLPHTEKAITVIGDKFLTDELFAKNIKADFIKVRRYISGRENWQIRLTYWFDDFIYQLSKRIKEFTSGFYE